jgi:cell surface protein SprA
VNYPITKNLKLDYSATVNARIQEPFGQLNSELKRDSVRKEFWALGRMRDFNQVSNFNYTLPLDKIGFLNWINTTVRYGANFGWTQAPPAFTNIGNTIQNGRELTVTTQLNMNSLYNKIPFLRKINQGPKKTAGVAKNEGSAATAKNKKEKQAFGTGFFKTVMMLKNANLTYTLRDGIMLPGFIYNVDYFGQNFAHSAPGLPFILGSQNDQIRYDLAKMGALTQDTRLNNFYTENHSKTMQGNATIEPFKDFRVQVNFNLTQSNTLQTLFKYDTVNQANTWRDMSLRETGNFTMTGIFIQTANDPVSDKNNWTSTNYNNFENFRFVISQRQAAQDPRVLNKGIDKTNNGKFYYRH